MRIILITILTLAANGVGLSAVAFTHIGEDGMIYDLDPASARVDWLFGKVDPAVLEAASAGTTIDVAVHIARPAPTPDAADPVALIKAGYKPQLDTLSRQMRDIWKRALPAASLDARQEREFLAARGLRIDARDSAMLRELQREHDSLRTAMHKDVGAALHAAGLAERREVGEFVAAIGGRVHAEVALINSIAATIPSDAVVALAKHRLVTAIVLDPETSYKLDVSTPSAGYDVWHSAADGPFLGGGYDFGIVDSGVQEDHPGFSNVNAFFSNFPGIDDDGHGTHVTGIVVNDSTAYPFGGPYTGTATDLDSVIWGQASDTQTVTMARMDDLMTDFTESPEVVNHSIGYNSSGGLPSDPVSVSDYVPNDSFYDAYALEYDVQVTQSAGNDGWSANATMTFPSNAYNIIVVANMDDRNTLDRSDDIRNTSSSVGPTLNGRRKPDITASGTNIISTNAFWSTGGGSNPTGDCTGNPTDMCSKSGSSMAAAQISGAIVLQHDGGNLEAQAQKAVLLNTADWWTSNGTETTSDDSELTSQNCPGGGSDPCETAWDRSYGWGYIDMGEALINRGDVVENTVIPRNNNAVPDDYDLYKGQMFANEKATLTWEKRHTTYMDDGPAFGRHALSDINMHLYSNGDGRLMDADIVANDNVHQVAADADGMAVVKVYAWSTDFAGASTETYWLATEENFVQATPPEFAAAPLIMTVGPSQTFVASVEVTNVGDVGAHDASVAIPIVVGIDGGGVSQDIGTLADGEILQVDFTLTTNGLASGLHSVPVTVTSDSYAETYVGNFPDGIQFDVETDPPSSDCSDVPSATSVGDVAVPFTANDGFFGTGIDVARLYVRTPGSPIYVDSGLELPGNSGTFLYTMTDGDGLYRFAIRARDIGGTWEPVPGSAECSTFLDRVIPESTVSSPLIMASGFVSLTWSVNDPDPSSGLDLVELYYWEGPNGPWLTTGITSSALNGVQSWMPPGPGAYQFRSRAVDNAQNTEEGTFDPPPGDSVTNYGNFDTDGDFVLDFLDNCAEQFNPPQRDTDGDGIGNLCDPDVIGDCLVNFLDLNEYKANFFVAGDLDTDNDGDGLTNFADLNVLKAYFFGPPGPGAAGSCNF